jgi:hypothetical protein
MSYGEHNIVRLRDLVLPVFLLIFGLYGTYQGWSVQDAIVPFFLLVLLITGLYIIYSGLRSYLFIRKIKNIPTFPVCSAGAGPVALIGRAMSGEPDRSPISGIPCVYWRITGEYYYWMGIQYGIYLRLFHSAESKTPFYVQDETGRMLIEPQGADMDIHSDIYSGFIAKHGIRSEEPATMDERALKYIDSLEKNEQQAFREHKFIVITEYFIPENDSLYVIGQAVPVEPSTDPLNSGNLKLRKAAYDSIMYIADTSPKVVISNHSTLLRLRILGGLVMSAGCLFLFPFLPELEKNNLFTLLLTLIVAADVYYILSTWKVKN